MVDILEALRNAPDPIKQNTKQEVKISLEDKLRDIGCDQDTIDDALLEPESKHDWIVSYFSDLYGVYIDD